MTYDDFKRRQKGMSFQAIFMQEMETYERTGDGTNIKKLIIVSGLLRETIQACTEWGMSEGEMIRFVRKYGKAF